MINKNGQTIAVEEKSYDKEFALKEIKFFMKGFSVEPNDDKAHFIAEKIYKYVEKDGSITNAAVMRGIDKECDAEALRVVSSMPKWNPGQHKGEVVRTQFTIPIYYKFN